MSVTFKSYKNEVKRSMGNAKLAALTNIGIAARHNIQDVILEKDIYDTGELYRTTDYGVREMDDSVDIGSPKNYAPFQELGTSRQLARPFIRPGILDHVGEYEDIAGQTISAKMK